MRFAYADPPYVGQAKHYPGGKEVNHRLLIEYLEGFDGWALSCSVPSLKELLGYVEGKHRVLAWTKRYVCFRPGVWPCYAWEPVICKPLTYPADRTHDTPMDYCNTDPGGFRRRDRPRGKQRILGEKPPDFVVWVLRCCKVAKSDEVIDIFPGSGAVGEAVDMWHRQGALAL